MKRKSNKGRKPLVTGREMESEWKDEKSCWFAAEKNLDTDKRKMLLAVLVSEEVQFVMSNHMFRFKNKLFNQTEGGSIGSELTQVLGTARMIVFLKKLQSRFEVLGLKSYFCKAFVDDVSIGMKDPGCGYFVSEDELVWTDEKQKQDEKIEDDVRVAELVVMIANTLPEERDIQMTFDAPSRN